MNSHKAPENQPAERPYRHASVEWLAEHLEAQGVADFLGDLQLALLDLEAEDRENGTQGTLEAVRRAVLYEQVAAAMRTAFQNWPELLNPEKRAELVVDLQKGRL